MDAILISKTTARRFVLGRQGLWPGRRWSGTSGAASALHTIEAVQMDPLNVVARSHDIVLWSRVRGYQPADLDQLLYHDRQFFDYGGGLFIYPMAELPFWRLHMRRREREPRWATFASEHSKLLDEVRAAVRARGPLGNRDFTGHSRVQNYRGRKDSALALYYLWLTGELLIAHRQGFERFYDLRERIAPPELDYAAPEDEAEDFFARKNVAFMGLIRERAWANGVAWYVERRIGRDEAQQWIESLIERGEFAPVRIEGAKERWLALAADLPLLAALEAGQTPESWRPLTTTTTDEMVFLAPLDIVSARGRASQLFDFEYLWEVYKPAAKRRWGYYTLPILYGDRLVARLDPKLDRGSATLQINGFWLEQHAPADAPEFAAALARGLQHFAEFLRARQLNIAAIEPQSLRAQVRALIERSSELTCLGST
jgi:uncharacterized protein YcaQ